MLVPDNPLVFVSPGFNTTTQYSNAYIIGKNCRLLQGPSTRISSTKRIVEAIAAGQETVELLCNYRRDGSAFLNLLLIAPLYDNKGSVRYFIGCQVDVSNLIVGGRGLESFEQLLTLDKANARFNNQEQMTSLRAIGDLAQLLTNDESDVVKRRDRSHSQGSEASTPVRPGTRDGGSVQRRRIGLESAAQEPSLWGPAKFGSNARLPGVYKNVSRLFPSSIVWR